MIVRKSVWQGLHQQLAAYQNVDANQTETINELNERITSLLAENSKLTLQLSIVTAEADENKAKYETAHKLLMEARKKNAYLGLKVKEYETEK